MLKGEVMIPGDKSISHRALMFNAIGFGQATLENLLMSKDIKATINVLKALGVKITMDEDICYVTGRGFDNLKKPSQVLDCMNSGTTARLMMGYLSGLDFDVILTGDNSLSRRPMGRVERHLKPLQANITLKGDNYLPAHIKPTKLVANEIFLDVSSAQVKSAVILSALKIKEKTIIHELSQSRNHTEIMLAYMDADLKVNGLTIEVTGKNRLSAKDIKIPGDISSAAFFIAACLITRGSEITIKNCGLNPTRTGILKVLDQIGAHYEILNLKQVFGEVVGDIHLHYQEDLKPFTIDQTLVPLLIDEIPVLTLLATQINGISVIKDAKELRVKESDRIKTTYEALTKLGATIIELEDGMMINGKTSLHENTVDACLDHRISLMLKVARIICPNLKIENTCDEISYPHFENDLQKLIK